MSSGVIVTMGVFVLIGLFGLIILWDRKKTEQEETAPQRGRRSPNDPHRKMGLTRGAVAEKGILRTFVIR